jgi:hypothetical protein
MELLGVTHLTMSLFLLLCVNIISGFEHTFNSNASVGPVTPFDALVSLASHDFSSSLTRSALTTRQELECEIPGGRMYFAVVVIAAKI